MNSFLIFQFFLSDSGSSGRLPFPTDPEEFWLFALNQQFYGNNHLLLGVTLQPEFKWPNGTTILTGSFFGALIAAPGAGKTKKKLAIEILLKVSDYTFVNLDGSILMEYDNEVPPAPPAVMTTIYPKRVFDKFREDFGNPRDWPKLTAKYNRNPTRFVRSYLRLFYPVSVHLNFNIKIYPGLHINRLSENRLRNKEYISLNGFYLDDGNNGTRRNRMETFLPMDTGFATENTIELVDYTNNTIVEIHELTTMVSHTGDERICNAAVNGKLSVTFIKNVFDKLGRDPNTGKPITPTTAKSIRSKFNSKSGLISTNFW